MDTLTGDKQIISDSLTKNQSRRNNVGKLGTRHESIEHKLNQLRAENRSLKRKVNRYRAVIATSVTGTSLAAAYSVSKLRDFRRKLEKQYTRTIEDPEKSTCLIAIVRALEKDSPHLHEQLRKKLAEFVGEKGSTFLYNQGSRTAVLDLMDLAEEKSPGLVWQTLIEIINTSIKSKNEVSTNNINNTSSGNLITNFPAIRTLEINIATKSLLDIITATSPDLISNIAKSLKKFNYIEDYIFHTLDNNISLTQVVIYLTATDGESSLSPISKIILLLISEVDVIFSILNHNTVTLSKQDTIQTLIYNTLLGSCVDEIYTAFKTHVDFDKVGDSSFII